MTAQPATPGLVHRASRTVKWGECDFAGIAYTPRYGDWCIELIEAFYACMDVRWQHLHSKLNLGSPFVKLHLDFKSPVMLDDQLDLELSVEHVGSSSIAWAVAGRVGAREVFRASIVNVIIDKENGRATAIPATLRERLVRASDVLKGECE